MSKLSRMFLPLAVFCVLAGVLVMVGAAGASADANAPADTLSAGLPLAELRRPDGTLDLTGDYAGAVDPAGWRLVMNERGQPRFAPADGADTGAWDASYGAPGANMDFGGAGVYALAVDSQGRLYVGGDFEVIGSQFTDNVALWDGTAWRTVGRGVNGVVRALAVDAADNVYVGGDFTVVTDPDGATRTANRIARWDGTAWSTLGDDDAFNGNGVNNSVRAIAIDGGDVYVGGTFTAAYDAVGLTVSANRIARWNGAGWHTLGAGSTATGNGVNGQVNTLAVGDGLLYAGGQFTTAYDDDGSPVGAGRVVAWDPVAGGWQPQGNGVSAEVHALAVAANGDLYVGGAFTIAYDDAVTSVPSQRLARWNGSSWSGSPIVSGVNAPVHALALDGDRLYFGGNFSTLQVDGSDANAVGTFDMVTGAWGILGADQNGGTFSAPVRGNGVNTTSVRVLLQAGGGLYVGGQEGPFRAYNSRTSAVGIDALARWEGGAWYAVGSAQTQGANSRPVLNAANGVRALAVDGNGNLYVGGGFSAIGHLSANNIARWDGTAWHLLGGDSGDKGNGVDGTVHALALDGNGNLYAGGAFRKAYSDSNDSGLDANYVARWDGAAWQPLGPGAGATGNGVNGTVYALAADAAGTIYVGGQFTTAYDGAGVSANRVARWDGTGWNALGSGAGLTGNGVNNTVYALAVGDGELFVGGQFTTAYPSDTSSIAASRIARWDGATWHALGSGLNGTARALLTDGGDLYAGGQFGQAGGVDANKVARWDGAAWQPLGAGSGFNGNGVNGDVYGLGLSADGLTLLVGGAFTAAYDDVGSSVPAARAAAWTVTGGWTAFGSGLDATVYTVAGAADGVWAGGAFTRAGGNPSTYVGRWRNDALTADVAVAKSASAAAVTVGEPVTYTIDVSNGGPISATGVTVTDTVSLAATLVVSPTAGQGSCTAVEAPLWQISCVLGAVQPGQTVSVTYVMAPAAAGELVNTVVAASETADPNPGNNGASLAVNVTDPPTPTPTPSPTPSPTPTPAPADLVLRRSVIGAAGASGSGGSLRLRGTLGQSGPIGGASGATRTVGSGYWGSTVPIIRAFGGGTLSWDQVELVFPPLLPGHTVWLIPQQGAVAGLDPETGSLGVGFHAEVYDASGTPVTAFTEPYTVTVVYDDAQWQVAGLVEDTLTLAYYDEASAAWIDTQPCAGCTLDVDANVLEIVLDHATEFAVVGTKATPTAAVLQMVAAVGVNATALAGLGGGVLALLWVTVRRLQRKGWVRPISGPFRRPCRRNGPEI